MTSRRVRRLAKRALRDRLDDLAARAGQVDLERHPAQLLEALDAAGLDLTLRRTSRWPFLAARDARATELLHRWATALTTLAGQILDAEHAAALGPGQAELRGRHRGGDPVTDRITAGEAPPCPGCPYEQPCDLGACQRAGQPRQGPTWAVAPGIADKDLARWQRLRAAALGRLAYDLAWLEHALEPPARHPPEQQAG